ncbi:MAG: class II glutamine amidotransferase [Bacteroidota bacterium]
MSELIKHECGIAVVRLLKPLDYYKEKYGTPLYGMNKLRLLMKKQRNRGQDGAGIATIKLSTPPGVEYMNRVRRNGANYLDKIFNDVYKNFKNVSPKHMKDAEWLKKNKPFVGELLLGHLRYGTHGLNAKENCHPFIRKNNWISRNLILAGNFNLTNVDELFEELVALGQSPREKSDTVTVLEKIGHFLDSEVARLHAWHKPDGHSNEEINELIYNELDVQRVLQRASKSFDGGYVMAGLIGHGDAFVMRDPNGIRPAFYYKDEEVVVAASERPAIQTTFDVHIDKVKELERGHALIIKKDGRVDEKPFVEQGERTACSFERIYFSRGTDGDIYLERKELGKRLTKQVLESVEYDFENTVFSFIPNTAETAFIGLQEGIEEQLDEWKEKRILEEMDDLTPEKIHKILSQRIRVEKLVVKDEKLRTFIADDDSRSDLVSHVYDVTYGIVKNDVDTLVLLDDSIVRGTTLQNSILKIVSRLRPKKIVIVSSAPQIRYPDCYGIDMSKMHNFAAFKALIALLEERGKNYLLDEVYEKCKAQLKLPASEMVNEVKRLYEEFTYEEVSQKIAEIVTPPNIKPDVEVIYQTVEGLHQSCPNNNGDWYFSGNYPTAGGRRISNKAFVYFMERKDVRAYA